jgi:hypothetical protein
MTDFGMPAEAVSEMRETPVWAAFESVAPTLAYDNAVMGNGSVFQLQGCQVPELTHQKYRRSGAMVLSRPRCGVPVTFPSLDCRLSPPLPFLWPGSTVGRGGKHAAGGALPAPARQRLASALVAENEGQRMALASKTALISHHLLRTRGMGRPR